VLYLIKLREVVEAETRLFGKAARALEVPSRLSETRQSGFLVVISEPQQRVCRLHPIPQTE
jgi:hypothetical protein